MQSNAHWYPLSAVETRDYRSLAVNVIAAGMASCIIAAAGVYLVEASTKVMAAATGAVICAVIAYLCGNPRLLCLWGLTFVIPFDLSKRFGTIFMKMGGESSFRAEVSDVFLIALAGYLAHDIWTGRVKGLRIPKVTYTWVVLMLLGLAWATFGTWRLTAMHEVARMFKVMILFLVISNELTRPERIFHCAAGLTLGMLVQAIAGLTQYVTRSHFGLEMLGETGTIAIRMLESSSVQGQNVFRVGAFLSHPNVFGIFLACLLPFAVAGFLLRVGKVTKLFFLSGVVLGMSALIVTLSRSGWVSFAAAFSILMLVMILHTGLRRRSMLAAGIALIAVLAVAAVFVEPIMSRIFSSREAAMLGRAEYLRDASGMIDAKPWFGWGLNSYVFAVPPFTQYGARFARVHYQDWIPPVHNIYYLWWAEIGIVGLGLQLIWLIGVISSGIKNLRVKNEMLFAINAACLAGMLAFVVDGFFSFSLRFNSILRVFWVQAGMMMAIRYYHLKSLAEDRHESIGRA